jgi:dihydroflavonol-4-reductase
MKIGVTGASGHVGGNICRLMLNDGGYNIRAMVFGGHDAGIKGLAVEIVEGNVLDYDSLLRFMDGLDVIIHLAGKISIDGDPDGSVRKINYDGSLNVIRACQEKKISKLIYFSSIHAMNPTPLNEEMNEHRELVGGAWKGSAYDRSKADVERHLKNLVRDTGFNVAIMAPTSIMGPYDFQPSLQGSAIIDIYKGKLPAMIKGGYDWVDVRDVARATIDVIHHSMKGEKYIISGEYLTLKEFADLIAENSPKKAPSIVLPIWVARLGVPFSRLQSKFTGKPPTVTNEALDVVKYSCKVMSHKKAAKAWGYEPMSAKQSIKDAVEWFKKQGMV